jgi:hypothetical protein
LRVPSGVAATSDTSLQARADHRFAAAPWHRIAANADSLAARLSISGR